MSFDTFLNNEINNMINSLDRLVSIPSVGTEAVNDAPFGQEALKALEEVANLSSLLIYENLFHR